VHEVFAQSRPFSKLRGSRDIKPIYDSLPKRRNHCDKPFHVNTARLCDSARVAPPGDDYKVILVACDECCCFEVDTKIGLRRHGKSFISVYI
jgi:hypothetical protein